MSNCAPNPGKIQRNTQIAQDRLSGLTYHELGAKYDLDPSQVCRILQDDEIREVLKQGTNQLVSLVPLAIDNYQTFLTDKNHADHYKASKDCLQNTGILSSHTGGNVYIDKMMVVNSGPRAEDIERIRELLDQRRAIDVEVLSSCEDED